MPGAGDLELQKLVARGNRARMDVPAALDSLREVEVEEAAEGGIEVAGRQFTHLLPGRPPFDLVDFDLVGKKEDLLEGRHAGAGSRVSGNSSKDFARLEL